MSNMNAKKIYLSNFDVGEVNSIMIVFRHLNWVIMPGSIVHDTATIPIEVGPPELFY